MPKRRILTFTAWSFSRLTDYEKCAFMAYCKYLDPNKPKFKPNKAMQRGTDIHTKAEKYSIGLLRKLPRELELFEEEFKDLRKIKRKLQVEGQLALNKNWRATEWFGQDTWLRVKMDVMWESEKDRLKMVDYKTGKPRPVHMDQLDLYAAAGFALFPHIDHIDSALWYLDLGEDPAREYHRGEFEGLKKMWVKRTKKMMTDKTFKKEPGDHCRWCDFSKSRGGPCKY